MANPPILSPLGSFPQNKIFLPMAANKTFVNAQLVGVNAGGFLVPWTISASLKCAGLFWGPSQTSPSGADGQYGADVLQCVVQMYNGMGGDAITAAQGQVVYSPDGYTAYATSDTSTLSPVGLCVQFDANTQVSEAVVVTVGLADSGLIALVQALSGVVTPITVANGGTGLAALTAHNLIVGNGTSAGTLLAPGTVAYPLVSQGAGSDPHYAILAVAGGGTGSATAAGAVTNLGAATAGNNTSSVAPAFTGTYAAITPVTGATVSWATNVATQSAGGVTAAANVLAGGFIDDGTNTAVIISNTTCTATTGTITIKPLTKLPAPTGTTVTIVPPAATTGTVASHAHAET